MRKETHKIHQSTVALAFCNLDSWLHTPRTLIMFVAAVLTCFVESQKLFRTYSFDGYSLNIVESIFLLAYTGFNLLMSSMMFFVMISELPRQLSFQYYSLIRFSKRKWLNSQVLYCLGMVVAFLLALLLCAFVFCSYRAAWHPGWSPILRREIPSAYVWISESVVGNCSTVGALLAALVPIVGMWFTLSMFLLLMNLLGVAKLGLMAAAFALIADYISIQSDLPVSPMQYATLFSIDSHGSLTKTFVIMVVMYFVINALLYIIMWYRVKRMDLSFDPQKNV